MVHKYLNQDIDSQKVGNYKYDAIGNLISDDSAGIDHIFWTVYGKIDSIHKTNGTSIKYTYDASGNRISKTVRPFSGTTDTTVYVRDASGNVMTVYEKTDSLRQTEIDMYGSSRLGIVKTNLNLQRAIGSIALSDGFDKAIIDTFTRGNKFFELDNHLGNVLVTVSDKKVQHSTDGDIIDYYLADVINANDYAPFGMQLVGRTYSNGGGYRYGFNGKRKDDDINGSGVDYDYGARIYDARLGRWLSPDPSENKYPFVSPYVFVLNTPIQAFDPDGKRVYFIAGAGNDNIGWNYVNRFKNSWTKKGIQGFTRIDASHGKLGDIDFTNKYRNTQNNYIFSRTGVVAIPASSDEQVKKAVNDIVSDLTKHPLKAGEQLNLTGYSYGAILQEQIAIQLANKGYKVDNLILIASPTSDNSPLMKDLQALQSKGKIGQIIRHDIPGDKLSNPKSDKDYIEGSAENLIGSNGHHFDLARPGAEADKKIDDLGDKLKKAGVK